MKDESGAYLFGSLGNDPENWYQRVFFRCLLASHAKPMVRLFTRQYGLSDNGWTFGWRRVTEFHGNERQLIDDNLCRLAMVAKSPGRSKAAVGDKFKLTYTQFALQAALWERDARIKLAQIRSIQSEPVAFLVAADPLFSFNRDIPLIPGRGTVLLAVDSPVIAQKICDEFEPNRNRPYCRLIPVEADELSDEQLVQARVQSDRMEAITIYAQRDLQDIGEPTLRKMVAMTQEVHRIMAETIRRNGAEKLNPKPGVSDYRKIRRLTSRVIAKPAVAVEAKPWTGPTVVLGRIGEKCKVLGKEKLPLTPKQFQLINELLAAGDEGMTKDALEAISSGARATLRRLRNDIDWARVIQMADRPNQGYRIRSRL